jgi:hypothetical protein
MTASDKWFPYNAAKLDIAYAGLTKPTLLLAREKWKINLFLNILSRFYFLIPLQVTKCKYLV